ncbi:MAG: hypothetical protein COV67_08245 [Nitrospinae bacterium CG11_big_fil_rev_8_21_14_0_20_56_8]|nr:MAG: hypothetical protein COV67_08245 [Nitrospinae bacterium CG11_big_fil_rev_8_21_14_0_20_56_8]
MSPPLETILQEQLGLKLPAPLLQKEMQGYCLHSDHLSLHLKGEEDGATYAVNRSQFDAFLLEEARRAGAVVNHTRVTGLEFSPDRVLVYSDGENCSAAVVVGAFGLDDGTCRIFEQSTPYRQPDFLNTVITRLDPGADFLERMGPTIQAFLLSFQGLEFGAVTPKKDHLSINIAGRSVSSQTMLEFLRSAPVQRFLPPHHWREKPLNYFKGKFPIAPAKHLFGDRYVTVGDAAGLMRPFKGKGINSACLTGIFAARTILRQGVLKEAFRDHFYRDCNELTQDLPYGRIVRFLTILTTRFRFMDHLLAIAAEDPRFMKCLFNSVSGHKSYKAIFKETVSVPLGYRFLRQIFHRFILGLPAALPAADG